MLRPASIDPDSAYVTAVVSEVLESLLTRSLQEHVLQSALARANESAIPGRGPCLQLFLNGPLRDVLTEALGPTDTELCLAQVQASLDHAGGRAVSGIRSSTRQLALHRPVVHLASRDKALRLEFPTRLDGNTSVHAFEDTETLARHLEVHAPDRLVVVLDCRSEPAERVTIDSLQQLFPPQTRVILWGANLENSATSELPESWTSVAQEATAEEVAWLCGAGQPTRARSSRSPAPTRTILVVDDDELWCRTVTRVLRGMRYEVTSVTSGAAALSYCSEHRPALIITDQQMPEMSGLQMSNVVQLALGSEAPPIVLITGVDTSDADISPICRLLRKPVDPVVLVKLVEELVTRRKPGVG